MRVIATLLCSTLIVLSISGCGGKEAPKVEYVYVQKKCIVPKPEYPAIDNTPCADKNYPCKTAKAEMNYIEQKKYGESWEKNAEVCR